MSGQWVDFKELRRKLRFGDVLEHYRIELRIKGDRATGFCPLPGHSQHEGKRRSPSFSANLARGVFNCFSCGRGGNTIEFAAIMEGIDPSNPQALRAVALQLQERFLPGDNHRGEHRATPNVQKDSGKFQEESRAQQKPGEVEARPVIVNAPLHFTLKMLDVEHPYPKERGLTAETIANFGLGYCSRGLMQGRIVIPLHDSQARLIGYSGRLVDDLKIDDENPKYRFPGQRVRDGTVYEFRKSAFLYNGHGIAGPVNDLIVVEGFASVWWLWQQGYQNVVSLMGSSCSRDQTELIVNLVTDDGHVWVFPDGDDAGDRCAQSLFDEVGKYRFVRWASLDDGQQPTDCSPLNLSFLLPPHCFDHSRTDGK